MTDEEIHQAALKAYRDAPGCDPRLWVEFAFRAGMEAGRQSAALAASGPAADERVNEHMKAVEASRTATSLHLAALDAFINGTLEGGLDVVHQRGQDAADCLVDVANSARSLLGSKEDSEYAAMYRWLREQIKTEASRVAAQALLWNHSSRAELDKAIRAAMVNAPTKGE